MIQTGDIVFSRNELGVPAVWMCSGLRRVVLSRREHSVLIVRDAGRLILLGMSRSASSLTDAVNFEGSPPLNWWVLTCKTLLVVVSHRIKRASLDPTEVETVAKGAPMPSTFTWLDYSEHDRRRMMDVVSLFRERETRDELGIGAIRDAFADLFFPGTSTIQTRARYVLFVAWIYRQLEEERVRPADVPRGARQREIALIGALERGGERTSVIGIDARERLQRLPSNIYWQALAAWGIRLFHGSQEQYHRSFASLPVVQHRNRRNDDGEPIEGRVFANWHAGLPPAPNGLLQRVDFQLSPEEAAYLQERITFRAPSSLLTYLVGAGISTSPTAFPWEHLHVADFPAAIRTRLGHARNFSELFHGAALLYNLLLAEQTGQEKRIHDYRTKLGIWYAHVMTRASAVQEWDIGDFWSIVLAQPHTVTMRTRRFVEWWIDTVRSTTSLDALISGSATRSAIADRERSLKGAQARLHNRRALELWSGAAGTAPLSYRWPVAQQMVVDILAGLTPRS